MKISVRTEYANVLSEVSENIFEYLELKDIKNCRHVSKSWRKFIDTRKHWLKEIRDELENQVRHEWIAVITHFMQKCAENQLFTSTMIEYYLEYWMENPAHWDFDPRWKSPLCWAITKNYVDFIRIIPFDFLDMNRLGSS